MIYSIWYVVYGMVYMVHGICRALLAGILGLICMFDLETPR